MESKLKPEINENDLKCFKGIPIYLNKSFLSGNNSKYQKMYNSMSRGYDIVEKIIGRIKYGDTIKKLRSDIMSKIEWANGISVLYVSIGTGQDLNFIPSNINKKTLNIYGADISTGMLLQCQKKFKNSFAQLKIMNCCAEDLPYEDNSFDVVFHVGGINFFNDKSLALKEMVRVAKPKIKIIISDETADYLKNQYQKSKLSKKYFQGETIDLSEIESCVPENVSEKKMEYLWDGKFYCLSFRKD